MKTLTLMWLGLTVLCAFNAAVIGEDTIFSKTFMYWSIAFLCGVVTLLTSEVE